MANLGSGTIITIAETVSNLTPVVSASVGSIQTIINDQTKLTPVIAATAGMYIGIGKKTTSNQFKSR